MKDHHDDDVYNCTECCLSHNYTLSKCVFLCSCISPTKCPSLAPISYKSFSSSVSEICSSKNISGITLSSVKNRNTYFYLIIRTFHRSLWLAVNDRNPLKIVENTIMQANIYHTNQRVLTFIHNSWLKWWIYHVYQSD